MKEVIANNSANQNFSSSRLPEFSSEEQELLKGANDVVFLNYYSTYTVTTATYNNTPSYYNDMQVTTGYRPEWNVANNGFPVQYTLRQKKCRFDVKNFRFTIQGYVLH